MSNAMPDSHHKVNVGSFADAADILEGIEKHRSEEANSVIGRRVHISEDKIETVIAFWKPIYFSITKDGRYLNGVEAYELGDPKMTSSPNQAPYIAMCNLMALEAIKIMGDNHPTVEDVEHLAFGTGREAEIADFWHITFAPTVFQSQWAWRAALAVMAGDPVATKELLQDFRDQLP